MQMGVKYRVVLHLRVDILLRTLLKNKCSGGAYGNIDV